MTTLCSSYGSSLSSLYFNDFGPIDDIYGSYIAPDPDYFDALPSIHDDVMKMETDNTMKCGSPNLDDIDSPLKQEIRNIDCMWSSNPQQGLLSTSAGSSLSDIVGTTTAVPLAAVTGSTQNIINNIKQENDVQFPVVVVANNNKLLQQKRQQSKHNIMHQIQIKSEPSDDYEQKLKPHSIPNNTRTQIAQNSMFPNTNTNATVQQSMQHIPPGTSLLRKSNPQQQNQQKKAKPTQSKLTAAIQIPKMYASEFVRERDQILTANTLTTASTTTGALYVRPDTPHSLDDDEVAGLTYTNDISCTTPTDANGLTTEFKHSVDLRACVIGSNNLSLTSADPTHFINHVSQELQDTSKNKIDLRFGTAGCSLNDVLDVLASNTAMKTKNHTTSGSPMTACSSSSFLNGSDIDSDEESLAGSNSASSMILDNSDDLIESYNDGTQSPVLSQASSTTMSTSSCGNSRNHYSSSNTRKHQQQYQVYMHSDHSYTRYKDGMEDLAPSLETPSDSDEEIDVVSIGDKKLPTNPSDKDRRALQTKVADKFSNARIVKNANGVRTIPPRRSISYELPYTPASNSPVKSLASSRYPSPASTPYHNQYTTKYVQQQQQMMSSTLAAAAQQQTEKARKRLLGGGSVINGIEYGLVATPTSVSCTKKSRGKKLKQQQLNSSGLGTLTSVTSHTSASSSSSTSSNSSLQRHYSLDETADTIEKRNLHNDMERQRRIGLKNLFEALKKQIPSIKDKERAPKVNILREAAKLCENLTHEERLLIEQKAMLKEQMRQKKEILARLRATVKID